MPRLSVAAVERLKPHPTKRLEIPDSGKPGLYLLIQPSGRKSWAVRYRFAGQPRKLTIAGFPSVDRARKIAQDVLDEVSEGRDPARAKQAARNAPSDDMADVFAQFLAKHTRKRNGKPVRNTSRLETGRLLGLKPVTPGDLAAWEPRNPKAGVLAHWAGRDVHSITKRDVLDLLDKIVDRGAPIVANRTLAALKTAFGWCVKRDILDSSPCEHIDAPAPEKSRKRDLTDRELVAVWRAADSIGYPYGKMVQLLLLTGQRRDEVRCLPRNELDLPNRSWTLPGARAKNDRDHLVPLSDQAMTIVEGLPRISKAKDALLFTIDGNVPVSNLARRKRNLDKAMRAELRKLDPEAEFRPFRLHDFRHTLKSWMKANRVPKDVRSAVQNHAVSDIDSWYGEYTFEKEKREALDAWARYIDGLLSGKPAPNVVPFVRASS
jgi:integrase